MFIYPWGTFAYKNLPFGLKNVGATFQRAMSYVFHDIRNIVQPHVDDLPTHSRKFHDHRDHLHQIFLRCRHYNIRLNPHKCILYVESGRLLGFIVSKECIRLDHLKFKALVNLSPPSSLLKQGTPFVWDEVAQKSFDDLKTILINAPLLHPPNYHRDYFLYLAASSSTIIMVLVQDDNEGNENVIYYLSRNILNTETHYAQVEKLALVFV